MTTRNLNCFIATASCSSRCGSELLFRLFVVATFCHIPKNIVYKLFVRVCLKMTMKSRHYVVIFRADRTNFFHSHLSSTFYINNKAEDSLLKRNYQKNQLRGYCTPLLLQVPDCHAVSIASPSPFFMFRTSRQLLMINYGLIPFGQRLDRSMAPSDSSRSR